MRRKVWGFFNLSLSVGLAGAAVYFLTAYQAGFENDAPPSNSNIPSQSELAELVSEAKEVAKSAPSRSTIAWSDAAIDIMKQTNTRTLTFSYEPSWKAGSWSPEDVDGISLKKMNVEDVSDIRGMKIRVQGGNGLAVYGIGSKPLGEARKDVTVYSNDEKGFASTWLQVPSSQTCQMCAAMGYGGGDVSNNVVGQSIIGGYASKERNVEPGNSANEAVNEDEQPKSVSKPVSVPDGPQFSSDAQMKMFGKMLDVVERIATQPAPQEKATDWMMVVLTGFAVLAAIVSAVVAVLQLGWARPSA